MKLKQLIFVAMSTLQEARYAGLLLVLFIAHFFCLTLFGSAVNILYESFNRTPASIALELLPGIMIAAGAYIPGNMLSRSAWSSIRPGLLLCIIASGCLILWDGGTSILVTVAVFCAGFGLAAITIGGGRELAEMSSSELPSAESPNMMRSRLFGSALGIVFAVLFTMSQWGDNFDVRALRITYMLLFVLLVLLLSLFTSSQRMKLATANNSEATRRS